ncbi:uncharacterized protein NESG_00768 [Nematocida ausubeli]|uniref:Uncharacterized protein n=1 Tax=Nematocida ausubeli (strain ATCC PRA-371 / ERTm2) TaxID=1913371 RepID=A0A086J399_NEMA1|nr:uncharacterized protein NESG_00768 [Nematocida ausubeli]KFG26617.1 hypothetical protein NESG_00768 [Nematocida ausubeli]
MALKYHILKVAGISCMIAVALCAPLEKSISDISARRKEFISLRYQTTLKSSAFYRDIEAQIDYNLMRIRELEKEEIKEFSRIKKKIQEETADIKDELFQIMMKMNDEKKSGFTINSEYNTMKLSILSRNNYSVPSRVLDKFVRMNRNEIICNENKVREVLYSAAPILRSIDGPETFIQNLVNQCRIEPDLSVSEILENNLHYLLPARMENREEILGFLSEAYKNPENSKNLKCELAEIQKSPLRLECDINGNNCSQNDMERFGKEGTFEWMLDVLMAEYIMNNGRFQGATRPLVALQRIVVQEDCPGKERISHLISSLSYNTDVSYSERNANHIGRHVSGLPANHKNKLVSCTYCRNTDLLPHIQGDYREIVLDMLSAFTLVSAVEDDGTGNMWTYFENYHYIWYRIKKYNVEVERIDGGDRPYINLHVRTNLPSITRIWAISLIAINEFMHEYEAITVTEPNTSASRN